MIQSRRSFLLFVALIINSFTSVLAAQNRQDIEIVRDRNFVGNALYGFMNGGSELYLEYGFKSLRVVNLHYKDLEYSVEIYTMLSPEQAFGIYSIHTFRCDSADNEKLYSCFSAYQFQAVVGCHYVSIVPLKKKEDNYKDVMTLFDYFTSDMEDTPVDIPRELGVLQRPISGKLSLLAGELAVSNTNPSLKPLLKGVVDYRIWCYNESGSKRAMIVVKDRSSVEQLKNNLTKNVVLRDAGDFYLIIEGF